LTRITPGFWLAALSLIGPIATVFSIRIMGTLPIIAAVAIALTWIARPNTRPAPDLPVILGVAAILATGAASSLWAPADAYVLERLLKLTMLFCAGLVLFHAARQVSGVDRRLLSTCLLAGYGIAGALLVVEVATDSIVFRTLTSTPLTGESAYRLNRPLVTLMLLTWPVLAILERGEGRIEAVAGAAILCLLAIVIAVSTSQTALVALATGMMTWLAMRWMPTATQYAIFGGLVVILAAMPWLVEALVALPTPSEGSFLAQASVGPRLDIWAATAEQIHEYPLLGLGLEGLRLARPDATIGGYSGANHPHNAALQIRVEFGMLGLAVATAILIATCRRIGRLAPHDRRLPITLVASLGTVALTSHGLWQSWWIGTIAVLAAFSRAVLSPCTFHRGV
jgi:O-antigen ligase